MVNALKKNSFLILIVVLLMTPSYGAIQTDNINIENVNQQTIGGKYSGHLRIFIVEITSRWNMENGAPYKHALLDFAFNDDIEIFYNNTYENSISWSGDIEEDNIQIIAAIYNNEAHLKYADPPLGRPFYANYVDAAAGVKPGETESNYKDLEFTHTVICEVGTASWCKACPGMADTLEDIYTNENYPFYYIEMITDKSENANNRMKDFNIKSYPTGFYDGGFNISIGGGLTKLYHIDTIQTCGNRDVHDLDFTLQSEWKGNGTVDINISIKNNEEIPNSPPEIPEITGPTNGKTGENQEYEISTTDPEGDDVSYLIDWGDNTNSDWIGPYPSGEIITLNHIWDNQGTFIIKVKAKDINNEETDWKWFEVRMPKQINLNQLFLQLSEYFPIFYKFYSIFYLTVDCR